MKIIKLDAPSDEEQFKTLVDSVKYAIHTEGYYWSSPNGAGGWTKVLQAYNPSALVTSGQNSGNFNRQRVRHGRRKKPNPENQNRNPVVYVPNKQQNRVFNRWILLGILILIALYFLSYFIF